MDFLFGKISEGLKEGTLWAVNRPFLLENSHGRWRILVYLRTVVYVAFAVGSLLAGFLAVWLLYEGTMLLCGLLGIFGVATSLLLVERKKEKFSVKKALFFLDFRKKQKTFKVFTLLFFTIGLAYGFKSGFVLPLFLDESGFSAEGVGLIVGSMVLTAGVSSYIFSKTLRVRILILLSGLLYSVLMLFLGFSSSVYAGILVLAVGFAEGMNSVGQEAILSKICAKESYGIDIGLLMMGLHMGESISLALSGFLISSWGFMAPFVLAASTYPVFYIGAFKILKGD